MPRENPYAAPQTVDPAADIVGEGDAGVSVNAESIRIGARLALKATWLVLLFLAITAIRIVIPELRDLIPAMTWILTGAAAFCFVFGMIAFWQATNAASIRRLMRIAMSAFGIVMLMNFVDDWYTPYLERTARIAWIALNNLLSMAYTLAYLRGIVHLGRIVDDKTTARCAKLATWAWGCLYAWIGGFYLLALSPEVRAQLQWIYSKEGKPYLIVSTVVLGMLMLIGLVGFIRALWRLKRVED